MQTFERYRPIIDDWQQFIEASCAPLPACIWTNTLKTSPEELSERLPLSPISWYQGGFRCEGGLKPSHQIPYMAGHYLIQEEAAMLPVLLLAPRPGSLVLDTCAAPGNKTAQMAVRMQATGLIIANDRNEGRLGILRRSINRLGLTNVGITMQDAVGFPCSPNLFDSVLADVPCSGEGTVRRQKKPFFATPPRRRALLKHIQNAILTRAYKLCKPGGYIVYATCTFAPEENEAIVDGVLRRYPQQVRLVDAHVPNLVTTPGLSEWKGQRFHPDMSKTLRLWPHHNDTGGFFAALLQKTGNIEEQGPASAMDISAGGGMPIVAALRERFGIPENAFDNFDFFQDTKGRSYLTAPHEWPASAPQPLQRGLPFVRTDRRVPKLKTGVAMLLGEKATRNVLELSRSEFAAYSRQNPFEIASDRLPPDTSRGYLLLRFEGMAVGLGYLRLYAPKATVESLLPTHWVHADLEYRQL